MGSFLGIIINLIILQYCFEIILKVGNAKFVKIKKSYLRFKHVLGSHTATFKVDGGTLRHILNGD